MVYRFFATRSIILIGLSDLAPELLYYNTVKIVNNENLKSGTAVGGNERYYRYFHVGVPKIEIRAKFSW